MRKILAFIIVFRLRRFMWVKELCVLRNYEIPSIVHLFLSCNFKGAIGGEIEVVGFRINFVREVRSGEMNFLFNYCFREIYPFFKGGVGEVCVLFEGRCSREVS